MKKFLCVSLCAMSLAVTLMGCAAMAASPNEAKNNGAKSLNEPVYVAEVANDSGDTTSDNTTLNKESAKAYYDFGLLYDETTETLSYNGKLVRYFEDMYPVGGGEAGISYFNGNGVVDVYAVRDFSNLTALPNGGFDPSGTLIELKEFTETEFKNRDITEFTDPSTKTAISGELPNASEMEQIAAEYKDFGVTYDSKVNQWYFNGEKVRSFQDIMTTNGEGVSSGKFSGSIRTFQNGNGTVEIHTVRDFKNVSADGVGKLIGIEKNAKEQIFQKGTLGLKNTAPVDFWSIDEFEAWMQTEKQKNQKLADAKDNSFYYKDSGGNYSCRAWSQADVDALYADWQNQLEKMKQGYHFTKTITTDDGGLLAGAVDPETWNANASVSLGSTVITMPDSSTVDLGQFNTSKEAEEAVKIYLETQVKSGTLTKAQADTILKNGNFN